MDRITINVWSSLFDSSWLLDRIMNGRVGKLLSATANDQCILIVESHTVRIQYCRQGEFPSTILPLWMEECIFFFFSQPTGWTKTMTYQYPALGNRSARCMAPHRHTSKSAILKNDWGNLLLPSGTFIWKLNVFYIPLWGIHTSHWWLKKTW